MQKNTFSLPDIMSKLISLNDREEPMTEFVSRGWTHFLVNRKRLQS